MSDGGGRRQGGGDQPTPLALAVDEVGASAPPGRSLRGHDLGFVRTVALSVGIQGPTAGVVVGPAVLAGIVGGSGALAYLLGLVAMAFVAGAFIVFSRSFNSSSSVYAFNGAALGPRYGFVSAWLLLLVYAAFAAGVYASTADIAQTLLASAGIEVWWLWIALAGWALTVAFALLSIGVSSVVIFVCEGAAVALIAAVAVIVVGHGHTHHHHPLSLAPFGLHGVALGVLGLGVVNAFSGFSGFEGAATLGAESHRSTRTIPLAIGLSLAASGGVYVVVTWIVDNAYPSAHALAVDPAPLVHLADATVGSALGTAVNAAAVVSAFGAQLACVNAASRLLFSLGREVGGPGRAAGLLTRTDRRSGAPWGAITVVGAATGAAVAAFAFEPTAVRALTIILQYGAYLIVVAYLLTVLAALAWAWSHGRRPLPLVALPIGALVLGYVLYDSLHPFPPAPFDWVVLAAGLSVAVGLAVSLVPAVATRLGHSELLRATRIG